MRTNSKHNTVHTFHINEACSRTVRDLLQQAVDLPAIPDRDLIDVRELALVQADAGLVLRNCVKYRDG